MLAAQALRSTSTATAERSGAPSTMAGVVSLPVKRSVHPSHPTTMPSSMSGCVAQLKKARVGGALTRFASSMSGV